MPPKKKKAPRKKLFSEDSHSTQPRLDFEKQSKDWEDQRSKIMSKIAVSRLNMIKLQQQQSQYWRQLFKNEIKWKFAEPSFGQGLRQEQDQEQEKGQMRFRITQDMPENGNLLSLVLGEYSFFREGEKCAGKQNREREEREGEGLIGPEPKMKEEYFKDFGPELFRALNIVQKKEV